jgi:hypothetical protein
LILKSYKLFWIFWKKQNPKEGESPIGFYQYTPPQPGGPVTLYGTRMIYVYPVIGEFCLAKMISVIMFQKMNSNHLDLIGGCPFPPAAVEAELEKVAYAQG